MNNIAKKIFLKLVSFYSKTSAFLMHKNRTTLTNIGTILVILLLIFGLVSYLQISVLQSFVAGIFCIILLGTITFRWIDGESKFIAFFTKGAANTPHKLFREMGHFSFLYGLFIFSFQIWYLILTMSLLIFKTFLRFEYLLNLKSSWFTIMFVFSFLYFAYHIYVNPKQLSYNLIQQRIDFYAAIGTTVGFIMLISVELPDLKIFFSGLALVFVWLKHLISSEKLSSEQLPAQS